MIFSQYIEKDDQKERDGSKTELVMKKKGKHKSTTSISASLTPDYREEESNSSIELN